MPKQQVYPGERLEKRHNTDRTNNAKTQQKEHEKTQHEKRSKLVKKKKKTRGKNAAQTFNIFLIYSEGTNTCLRPQRTTTTNFTFLPATCRTHENQKKRKTLTPGCDFLNKLTNENAVSKRFQISVSKSVNLIGPEIYTPRCKAVSA